MLVARGPTNKRHARSRATVRPPARVLFLALAAAFLFVGCGGGSDATPSPVALERDQPETEASPARPSEPDQAFPDVVGASARRSNDSTVRFEVTISSPYDSPERYADAWRVLGADRTVYGVRELLHDHGSEQPFTRSLDGVAIPAGIDRVTVEARDLVNGWGGDTREVTIPPPAPSESAGTVVRAVLTGVSP